MKTVLQPVVRWVQESFQEPKRDDKKQTIAVLDGVRGLAILFVIIFHINSMNGNDLLNWHVNPLAASIATAGGTGVTLFFVLSGLLLFMPYAKALLFAQRWPLARTFYLRRALRIMPEYYLSLFALILLTQPAYLQPGHWFNLGLFLTFFMDSSQLTFRQLDGPYWTLAVEWQFYILLPLLALGILCLVERVQLRYRLRAVTLALCLVIACAVFLRFMGFYLLEHPQETFLVPRQVLNVALFFLFGQTGKYTEDFAIGMLVSICYVYAQNLPAKARFIHTIQSLSLWLWGAGILILLFSAMWHLNSSDPAWSFLKPLMSVYNGLSELILALGYSLCILAILFGPRQLWRPFAWKPLRWLGLISYSLYIWHLPLLIYFHLHILPRFSGLNLFSVYVLHWVWVLVVILPFCLLCYIFVERPGIKLGNAWRKAIEGHSHSHQPAGEFVTSEKASLLHR